MPLRILFTVAPFPTTLFHMVPLAWACRAAGHEVRVAAQPELAPSTTGIGLIAVEVGGGYDLMDGILRARGGRRVIEAPARDWNRTEPAASRPANGVPPADEKRRLRDQLISPHVTAATRVASDLVRFAERWRPDLVITDPLLFAAPLVSAALDVPLLRHLVGPDVWRRFCPLQGQEADGDERERWPEKLVDLFDRFGAAVRDDHPVGAVDPWPTSLQLPGVAGRIPIRFVPYNGSAVAPEWVLERPGRPRVCVTWGTTTAALGGEDTFVLPRVLDALAGLDIEVILAVTTAEREKLDRVPGNVRIADGVPLHLLMPTCDAIVNQGGAGSVLTAAAWGVPQVIMPRTADTPIIAANVGAGGAAIALDVEDAALEAIGTAVTRTLTDDAVQAAARKLRKEIAETPSPAAVVGALEDLVARHSGARV
ncbi:nucleotide disphospho-sugar-binding domain-containing protein [Actinomadura sp. 3N407]|uniref:nucleotide disphospho-sugar-binding domain-containing protein n=1 Tax=Actinomadura sp. 3N407 TaxID=3457423 RepID=UPI003FCCA14E